jgi:HAD superfamily hydrolase (TIGR01549 family)
MLKAVLFDLDDTLTDRGASVVRYAQIFTTDFSRDLVTPGWEAVRAAVVSADERGYAPREQVFHALGEQLVWRGAPDLRRIGAHWEEVFPRASVLRAGARETVGELRERGFLVGLVTNGRTHIQRAKIGHLGLGPLLDVIAISEEIGHRKPHAEAFMHALRGLQCASSDAWFVGDHPRNDVLGSSAVGAKAVWVRGAHPRPDEHPHPERSVDAIPDLLPLIGRP